MSELLQCLWCGCSILKIGQILLDIVAPLVLEILVISVIFEKSVERSEKRKWEHSEIVLLTRLTKLQDKILMEIVPDNHRVTSVHSIACGKGKNRLKVNTLFDWRNAQIPSTDDLRVSLESYLGSNQHYIVADIAGERSSLNQIILAHSGHIEADLFGILLDIDIVLGQVEATSKLANTSDGFEDFLQTILLAIQETLKLRKWLFKQDQIKISS